MAGKGSKAATLSGPIAAVPVASPERARLQEEILAAVRRPDDLNALCDDFLREARAGNVDAAAQALDKLREGMLFQVIPVHGPTFPEPLTLRGKLWKTLLGVDNVSAEAYMRLIDKGKSVKHDKIRSDSFRTFPDEKAFNARVPETAVIRLCSAFVHKYGPDAGPNFSYLQGMNAITAPLLYCMPEVDAFCAFSKLIVEKFPLYWIKDIAGAHAGCVLVDQVLAVVDPELFDYLSKKRLSAYVYAFSVVSSLSSSVPPFEQVLVLWDFFMAYGVHMNVIAVVAQIIMMRDRLFGTNNPKELLDYRKWQRIRAREIIHLTVSIAGQLPAPLMQTIVRHPFDPKVVSKLTGRPVKLAPMKA